MNAERGQHYTAKGVGEASPSIAEYLIVRNQRAPRTLILCHCFFGFQTICLQ